MGGEALLYRLSKLLVGKYMISTVTANGYFKVISV
jgi:hypothetical protein